MPRTGVEKKTRTYNQGKEYQLNMKHQSRRMKAHLLLYLFWISILIGITSCLQMKTPEVVRDMPDRADAAVKPEPSPQPQPQVEYGINCKDMEVRKDVIRSRQNLSEILLAADVPYAKINEAVKQSRDIFDVRKIRAGNPYCLITDPSGEEDTCFFVYERDPLRYVVFELGEQVSVYEGRRPVMVRARLAEGRIRSSLLADFSRLGLDTELALQLAEIYAWTIDFYRIQPGDSFRIIYEEEYTGTKDLGTGRVKAARITHKGEDYYAFYYKQPDGTVDYYDQNGNSLRNAFLKAPLKYTRISSGYSQNRLHPILQKYRPHRGIDYAAPAGTPVVSVGDGVVEKMTYSKSMGNYVQIRHNRQYMTQYLHLSGFGDDLKQGAQVQQGDVIGYVGSTGLSTGPHLDFRFWIGDRAVNFLKQDIPTADPVKPAYMNRYAIHIADWKTDLDRKGSGDPLYQFAAGIASPVPDDSING